VADLGLARITGEIAFVLQTFVAASSKLVAVARLLITRKVVLNEDAWRKANA